MRQPWLRPHAVAVGGSVDQRHGIILAKNYRAKACGVKTGEALWEARRKCPDLLVVPPHYEQYVRYSKLAREIYSRYTDQVEPYGMDECWLDVSGCEGLFGTPEEIAEEIRRTVRFELGLTISVGVSFNKIFAKLGSDMKKPDAVTVIDRASFRAEVWPLPVGDLLGVGRSTQRLLHRYYIETIGDLARADPGFLRRRLGKNGVVLWHYANGGDVSRVARRDFVSPIKSIGHGITTVADLRRPEEVWAVMLELAQEVGHRLRVHGLCAAGVAVSVRDNELQTRQWQSGLDLPTQSALLLARAAFALFMRRYNWPRAIRAVTVRAIRLVPQEEPLQIGLFADVEEKDGWERLEHCVDRIRGRFCGAAVRPAAVLRDLKMPPHSQPVTMPTGLVR
jgi:DNA polymerase-4